MHQAKQVKNRMRQLNVFLMVCGLLFMGGLMTPPAMERAAAADGTNDYILEDTYVTATKKGETKIQETALSITAFDNEALKAGGVEDIIDIQKKTPNMSLFATSASQTMIYIRGVGNNSQYVGGSESVGVYMDDVYLSRYSGFWASYLDVQSVEVLRGPQGTLYGRNTSGGAIRIMSKNPTDEFSGYLTAEYGVTLDKIGVEGAIGGPIVKGLLKFRLAFLKSESEGALENLNKPGPDTVDWENQEAVRLKLQFTPSDRLDIMLTGNYSNRNAGNGYYAPNTLSQFIAAGHPNYELGDEIYINNYPTDFYNDYCHSVQADIKAQVFDSMTLRSITAYRRADSDYPWDDLDGTMYKVLDISGVMGVHGWSQEFQLNGEWGRFSLVGGLYYIHEHEYNENVTRVYYTGAEYDLVRNVDQDSDSYAAFASATFAVCDRFNVNAGLRYTYEERELNVKANFARYLPYYDPYGAIRKEIQEEDWANISPKVGADFRLNDDIFLFASVTKGYKGGGFNGSALVHEDPFDAEVVWSYEVGAKSDWMNNRLRVNATFFYYDYSDQQLRTFKTGSDGGFTIVTSNAGKSTVYGGELEITARPAQGLTLGANTAYTMGEYDEYIGADLDNKEVDLSGNKLMNTPEWTLNLFASYTFPLQDLGFVTVYGDYDWKDKIYTDPLNDELRAIDSYGLVNAQISFETTDGKWALEIYGKNLTDEKTMTAHWYIANILYTSGQVTTFGPYAQNPRRYGLRLTYKF